MFNRHPSIYKRKDSLGLELVFGYKNLIKKLNEEFKFPIGLKNNLSIPENIVHDWEKLKHVIRGLFDTDGSLYFDVTPVGSLIL